MILERLHQLGKWISTTVILGLGVCQHNCAYPLQVILLLFCDDGSIDERRLRQEIGRVWVAIVFLIHLPTGFGVNDEVCDVLHLVPARLEDVTDGADHP